MIHCQIKKALHGAQGEMYLDVNFTLQTGDFIALSGASGSGKTTLLRVLAGLEVAQGNITLNEGVWLSKNKNLSVQKREIGFVFQDYALFENMSVEKNLLFVAKDKALAKKLLQMTELYELKDRTPSTLSGGQKQRVSICRALMKKPKLLLLDEPLSALDVKMRQKLQNELLNLHKEFQTTTIMVSHDPNEITHLASRVLILEHGKIINDGSPKELLFKTQAKQTSTFSGEIQKIKQVDAQHTELLIRSDAVEKFHVGQTVRVTTH